MCHVLFVNQHILQTRIVAIVKRRRGRFKRASRLLVGTINIDINVDRNQESTRLSRKSNLNPSLQLDNREKEEYKRYFITMHEH